MTRGGILASGVALIAAGVFGLACDAHAQAKGKEAPLELKSDASVRPWKRYSGWPARDESKWNTLANLSSPPAPKAPRKITAINGDAANGAMLVADRNRGGSCLACHVMGQAGGADLPGNVGPDLSEIGNAGLSDEQFFNFIYDARVYNAETVMPPWGSHGVFNDQEIGDMVAFLKTLKTPAVFKTALDDPNKRPAPVEKRENLDAMENPGMWVLDKAAVLWKTRG
ncbi:MAG: sulfur oxidation c-type cytochrome SoxX, partial [Pseudolabrys sp.]